MSIKTLKMNFQRELLFSLILNMRKGEIDKKYARKIARALKVEFGKDSIDEFLDGVETLCKYSPEITEAFIKVAREYEEELLVDRLYAVRKDLVENIKENLENTSA